MAHTLNSPAEEEDGAGLFPAPRTPDEAPALEARSVLSAVGRDLVRAVGDASAAVRYLNAVGEHDVTVSAITVLECLGSTQAEALQAGADALRYGDTLTVHGLLWARVPGVEDRLVPGPEQVWSYRLMLLVSTLDPELGEVEDPTHQADAGNCGVVIYLDAGTTAPERALTGLPRQGLTQAGALQAAADTVRQRPELAIEGLLWARVAARRAGAWEYRLTLLTASAGGREGGQQPVYLDQAGR
ncbi:hypothetical protein [Kitasatospora sp. HPMI-4]|uniref:hypothetical protein n=1 Tax=Kitasatospora sp. HPMI-4 TaxID=3448443 RepID=UPI003F19AE16